MKNADMPAMPSKAEVSNTDEAFAYQFDHGSKFQFPGLTKREMFAMHAMQSLILSLHDGAMKDHWEYPDDKIVARQAVHYADALLNELEK